MTSKANWMMMERSLSVLAVCAVMMFAAALGADVFIINDMSDFWVFHPWAMTDDFKNKDCVLNCDLDFTGVTNFTPISWNPNGESSPFRGEFNGGGHTIKNLTVRNGASDTGFGSNAGFFWALGSGARVSNLHFDKLCSFYGENAGALAGYLIGSIVVIENVSNSGDVRGTAVAGGIIGMNGVASSTGTAVFQDCWNDGDVRVKEEIDSAVEHCASGGIAGCVLDLNGATFNNCYNYGSVSAELLKGRATYGTKAGGIIGQILSTAKATSANIDSCSNHGSVQANVVTATTATASLSGGIVGSFYNNALNEVTSNVNITNCVNEGNITSTSSSTAVYSSGIMGIVEESGSN